MVKSQEKVNGDRETTTQAVISMKEIIVEVAKMVLASSNGPLEIIIRVNF